MMRVILLMILLTHLSFQARAQGVEVLEPQDCVLLSSEVASADINSDHVDALGRAVNVSRYGRMSVHLAWGSLTGTLDAVAKVQVASTPGAPASGDWVDKADATYTLASAGGDQIISITNLTEKWMRLVYTHNQVSGGSVSAWCHAKSF
jgi:hypothetical protein